ncbi:class I SAM-dependent methyltransferase [Longirhabdus pacifica]|uniref:class I SAM-dependent methyltransferase n=1 Tax=Longirhabdus pacifica TaxID=2305227 RepID=UPI001F0C659B|nr:class I SAM-dependent methyltransferase [Longirhabdus pacifica]
MDHYYSKNPNANHQPHTITQNIKGTTFQFHTDAGVFSKRSVDFGSVLLMEEIVLHNVSRICDVGCGYGPIGLFIAKHAEKSHVYMVDINERAVGLAKQNATLNHIHNVTITQSDKFQHIEETDFDLVVSNPPVRAGKETVHSIFSQAHERLKPLGQLWIVIQKKQGAASAKKKLDSLFSNVELMKRSRGYHIYKATK